jgi:hypothetical protein
LKGEAKYIIKDHGARASFMAHPYTYIHTYIHSINNSAVITDGYITGLYMTVNHLGGLQYADFHERTLPLYWTMYPLMFARTCGFSTTVHLHTFQAMCITG